MRYTLTMHMTIKQHLSTARWLAELLDSKFSIFGFQFGLDPILSVVPAFGTVVPTVLSFYLLWIGFQINLPKHKLGYMIVLVAVDGAIGGIPLVGFLADAVLKANNRNLATLEKHLASKSPEEPIAVYRS